MTGTARGQLNRLCCVQSPVSLLFACLLYSFFSTFPALFTVPCIVYSFNTSLQSSCLLSRVCCPFSDAFSLPSSLCSACYISLHFSFFFSLLSLIPLSPLFSKLLPTLSSCLSTLFSLLSPFYSLHFNLLPLLVAIVACLRHPF